MENYIAGYVDRDRVCMMFDRYFHNLEGDKAQTLICDMKQAFLELSTTDVVPKAIVNLIFEDIFLCSEYENGKLVIDHDKIVGIKNRFQRKLNL